MECPICSKVFPASNINLHVNNCLNIHEDVGVTAHTSAPAADDTRSPQTALGNDSSRNIKRKTASWGSLQPMHLTTAPPQVKRYKNQQMRNAWLIDNQQKQEVEGISAPVEEVKSIQKLSSPCSATNATTTRVEANKENLIKKRMTFEPLAECMRPQNLTDYVGQEQVLGKNSMLYSLLQSDAVPSMILWGPPGCGKTSLAHIIASNCRSRGMAKFVSLSAAACGVNEVKDTIRTAHTEQKLLKKKTILFLDEIHRFNKTQQDVLLPHVENGTITLIGATTENPSFQVNSALLSRCRVVVLEKLTTHHILIILHKALLYVGGILITTPAESPPLPVSENLHQVYVEQKALEMLANLVDGDARAALNGLQMAVQAKTQIYLQTSEVPCVSFKSDGDNSRKSDSTQEKHIISSQSLLVTVDDIKEGLQRSHVLYDKTGEEHYNIISALHKSMRGSDASASLYWLARMLEGGENPLYIARRLIRFASEDVGLVDPQALPQAVAAYQACHLIGMPECDVILAQCAVYLARAPKSVEIYRAYGKAKACVRDHRGPLPPVPLHLRNAPTQLMKSLGNAKDYKYNPDYDEPVDQNYFPKELSGADFFN